MRKFSSRILYVSLFTVILWSCGGSGGGNNGGGGTDDDGMGNIPDPGAATLVFPENNSECTEGTIIDEDRSTITFQWNDAQNTDSYAITVTNLDTGISFTTFSDVSQADITVDRGTPYSWRVLSRAMGTNATAESTTFQFFNEGPGISNYAPFPATVISPTRGANLSGTEVDLEWSGSDVDGDIVDYEVFMDTNADPTGNSLGVTAETTLSNVSVNSGTTYYWMVRTRDSAGNTSNSEVFQFRIL